MLFSDIDERAKNPAAYDIKKENTRAALLHFVQTPGAKTLVHS
jgi:hypothetical protein